MNLIFWLLYWINILLILYKIFIKKIFYDYKNIIVIGIYIPLGLYFCRWSEYISVYTSEEFMYIFSLFNFIFLFFNFLELNLNIKNLKIIEYEVKTNNYLIYLNLFYMIFFVYENIYLTGTIYPMLYGIDIHTQSISAATAILITKNTIPIILINFLYFEKLRKRKYIIWILFYLFFPVITRGARSNFIKEICILIFFVLCYYRVNIIKFLRKYIIVIMLGIFVISYATEYRTNKFYSSVKGEYKDWIKYNGPLSKSKILPNYYGYYPMSFNNLDLSISDATFKGNENMLENILGRNTFRMLYAGIDDFLFNSDAYFNRKDVKYVVPAANVTTGFYDWYYDYKGLIYIPIFFGFLISHIFFKKLNKKKNVKWLGLYSIFIIGWLNMAFLNTLYGETVLYSLFFYYILTKIFIKQKKIRLREGNVKFDNKND